MFKQNTIEIAVGLFISAGIAALFMLAMQVSNLSSMNSGNSYDVTASFDNIGGLNIRSPIKASGVLIGRVKEIAYNNEDFSAEVTLSIQQDFNQFPVDSRASIYTAGLLGEQYVEIVPGIQDDFLSDGSHIDFTDPAIILEKLIGRIIADKISE